jgi:hypothetical protein
MILTRRIPSRLLAVATALAALAACVDNNADAPMQILRNLAPAEGCILDPGTTTFTNQGRIESTSQGGYLFTPLVQNNLTLLDNEATSPKTIFLEGARVELSFYDTTLFPASAVATLKSRGLTEFIVPMSGSFEPDGGTAALGFTIVPVDLLVAIDSILPQASATSPSPSTVIDARIQLFGKRGGGSTASNWFRYPVEVCRDCLVVNHGSCASLPSGFSARTGGVCNPLQDGFVDCCMNAAMLSCPAMPVTSS